MSLRARALRAYLLHRVKPRLGAASAITPELVAASRRRLDAIAARIPTPVGVRVRPALPGVRGEWLWPARGARGHGLYLHGGGYVVGSARLYRGLAGRLARATGTAVLVPDYALAPEQPFPAAVDDVLTAWRALTDAVGAGQRVWLAGDSAGGGLALSLAQQLCAGGDPPPAALALISPWTDLTASGSSVHDNATRDQYLSAHLLTPVAQTYLQGHDPRDARASPLFGPLGRLPPLTVHVCDSEILRDDSLRLVAAVQAAGGVARLRRFPDLPHVFHAFAPLIPEAAHAIEDLAASLTG